jgi:iron complex transport system substrate-binding protein
MINITGCSREKEASATDSDNDTLENTSKSNIVDLLDRDIELPKDVNEIVAIGPGALRLCSYFHITDKIVGIEKIDKDSSIGRPYLLAFPELQDLDIIGPGGPNASPSLEQLISVSPDIIFTTYATDKSYADELEAKLGIPIVALSYGEVASISDNLFESINLIGKILSDESRATEIIDYIESIEEDLNTRTESIEEDKKESTYIGCLGMKGAHGIESTQGEYLLFNYLNANNVADETGEKGSIMIDKEKLLEWNPDKIFVDYGGLQLLKEDYQKNTSYYENLEAFENNNVFSILPYNYYSTNISTALSDAYYIGKTLYPDNFSDIEITEKSNEIYEFFFGKKLYEKMIDDYGPCEKLNFE